MWRKTLWICGLLLLGMLAAIAEESANNRGPENPLSPMDLSSPRATLNTFFEQAGEIAHLARNEFWYSPSQALSQRIADKMTEMGRMFDLSGISPAARREKSNDAFIYLYEVLSRIELPPQDQIPDETSYSALAERLVASRPESLVPNVIGAPGSEESIGKEASEPGMATSVSWTIPNTEITLVRVAEGPQTGQFVFSADTVARAAEFYRRTRHLPYQREVAFENYAEMRPYLAMRGWWISPAFINALPEWMKASVFRQAVWKWIALGLLLAFYVVALMLLHRLSIRLKKRKRVLARFSPFLVPMALLLFTSPLAILAVQQLTLTDRVGEAVKVLAEVITYFSLAWVVWSALVKFTEWYIDVSRVQGESLNAHLLRFVARTLGVISIIVIFFTLSSRLGAPLFSLIAGFGVGGIAVALAAQGSIENFIGSLNLFGDKPVRVGDFCRYGEDAGPDFQRIGTVEAIGMRSTRIRGIDNTLTTIPNADFCKMHIVNYSTRTQTLFLTMLSLRYETTEDQLRYVLVSLREMLVAHPRVVDDEPSVRLVGMSDSSLEIEVRVDINTDDYFDFRAVREDILLRILSIVRGSGTGFAFPSQTLYYSKDSGLDKERREAAEARVREWAAAHEMPFPTFTPEQRNKRKNTLDYPPEGSPLADR